MAGFDAKRTATTSRFALELDGKHAAYIKELQGGDWENEVATNDHGPMQMQTKMGTTIKFAPFKAKIGIAQSSPMNDWIRASWARQYATKSGAIITADFNLKALTRRDFVNALISKVTVPAFDAKSKEAAFIEVEWEAENVLDSPAGGEEVKGDYGVKSKNWVPANFRFDLAGLTDACKRVSKIDSFSWVQKISKDYVGSLRHATLHPTAVTVPEIKITLSNADYPAWRDWAKAWFHDGKCTADYHKDGFIEFLSTDMSTPIGRIDLKQCGLKKVTAPPLKANSEDIASVVVELYVEEMEFNMTGSQLDL
jgi:phage tail-like protein